MGKWHPCCLPTLSKSDSDSNVKSDITNVTKREKWEKKPHPTSNMKKVKIVERDDHLALGQSNNIPLCRRYHLVCGTVSSSYTLLCYLCFSFLFSVHKWKEERKKWWTCVVFPFHFARIQFHCRQRIENNVLLSFPVNDEQIFTHHGERELCVVNFAQHSRRANVDSMPWNRVAYKLSTQRPKSLFIQIIFRVRLI